MISGSGSNTPPRIPVNSNSSRSHAVQGGRATLVTGERASPGVPCVVAISMGTPHPRGWDNHLMAYFQVRAHERGYQYQTVTAGSDPVEVADMLRLHVPEHAVVVLINTDASATDVQAIRDALPAVAPEGAPLDANDYYGSLNALNGLPVAQPEIAHGNVWDLPQLETALDASQTVLSTPPNGWFMDPLYQRQANDEVIQAQVRAMTAQGVDLSQLERRLHALAHQLTAEQVLILAHAQRPAQAERTVAATANNPVDILSAALRSDADSLPALQQALQQLGEAHDLSLLANLVTRAPTFKPMLQHLVVEMATDSTLAKRVFGVLEGAHTSCGDRVSLAFHRAELELLVLPVRRGKLNQDLAEVVKIARQVFRRDCIDRLAQKKVKSINEALRHSAMAARPAEIIIDAPEHPEEVETHLAYIVGLHDSLGLGGLKPHANFINPTLSGVTQEDIEVARKAVEAEEQEHFLDFLATWEPWQEVLRARFPDNVAGIENVLSDLERPARLEREVAVEVQKAKEAEVPDGEFSEGAITRAINQRGRDEQQKLWLDLTKDALSKQ